MMAKRKNVAANDPGSRPAALVWGFRLLVLFHFYVLIAIAFFWQTPHRALVTPILGYARTVGLLQWWNMFAPTPPREGVDVMATLRISGGATKEWGIPPATGLWPLSEISDERLRKLRERVRLNRHRPLWPDFARQIAKSQGADGAAIESVELWRSWVLVTSPYRDGAPRPVQKAMFHKEPLPVTAGMTPISIETPSRQEEEAR